MSGEGYTENVLWPTDPNAGDLIPLTRGANGQLHWAVPQVLPRAINAGYNALVGPGEILTGKTPLGAPAAPNPMGVAQDITGVMLGAGASLPAEANAFQAFGGLRAKAPDLVGRRAAIAAEKQGRGPRSIFRDTGWFRDKDNQWKFEIDDSAAKLHDTFINRFVDPETGYVASNKFPPGLTVGDALDHPDLYKQYPHLKDLPLLGKEERNSAAFYPAWQGQPAFVKFGAMTPENFKSAMHHELQHGIQHTEGFATGGSSSEFMPKDFNQQMKNKVAGIQDLVIPAAAATGLDKSHVYNLVNARIKDHWNLASQEQKDLLAYHAKNGDLDHPDMKPVLDAVDDYVNYDKQAKKQAQDVYEGLAGEVEARNVEERLKQSVSGARFVHPHDTQSYPWDIQQTVRFRGPSPFQQDSPQAVDESFKGWHGTPHTFDPVEHNPFGEFRDDKIGSGEGAQVYGYGHYVAGRRGTAKTYQENLGGTDILLNGERLSGNSNVDMIIKNSLSKHGFDLTHSDYRDNQLVYNEMKKGLINNEYESRNLAKQSEDTSSKDFHLRDAEDYRSAYDKLSKVDYKKITQQKAGNLLHLEVAPEEHELLDWDTRIGDHPQEILNKIEKIDPEARTHMTGEDFYNHIASEMALVHGGAAERAASQALRDAGIPGIKYADAGSRHLDTSRGTAFLDDKPIYSAQTGFSKHAPSNGSDDTMGAAMSVVAMEGGIDGALKYLERQNSNDFIYTPRETVEPMIKFLKENRHRIKFEAPKKSYNYVIFDPKHIKIIGRNGQRLEMSPVDEDPFQ